MIVALSVLMAAHLIAESSITQCLSSKLAGMYQASLGNTPTCSLFYLNNTTDLGQKNNHISFM